VGTPAPPTGLCAMKLLFVAFVGSAAAAAPVTLVSFDGNKTTTRIWHKTDDPVMGGKSKSTFDVADSLGIFDGVCAIVPSLAAPGFCKVATAPATKLTPFPSVSDFLAGGGLYLTVRGNSSFSGYKVAFDNANVKCPRTGFPGVASWKAPLTLPPAASHEFVTVKVPFNTFSCDWSGYTGGCDTKDPTGVQHVCCTDETPEVCPTSEVLRSITGLELWAEGAEGIFHLEIMSIGAGPL